jgi:tetratricopeptide (TPR) repeat protein
MLGIAAPVGERLEWNRRALAMAEASADPRTRLRWRGPLLNNLGWTYHELGEYAAALAAFERAVPAYEARGEPENVRIAHWAVARALRSLGRLDDAEAIQRRLAAEFEAIGSADPYVCEELAELTLARGDSQGAAPHAARAHAILAQDPQFKATEPDRLARLARIAAGEAPPAAVTPK